MKIGFADRDRPGRAEPFHHRRIVIGNKIFENQRAAGGTNAARIEEIFVSDGDAMKRTAIFARRQFAVALLGFLISARVCAINSAQEILRLRNCSPSWRTVILFPAPARGK
jgi:hypothetical protein